LTVNEGSVTSSIRYKSRREGRASVRRMIAGTIVQIVSTHCASVIVRVVYLFNIRENMAYPTKDIIITKIIIAWSWKKIKLDMIGEVASWKPH